MFYSLMKDKEVCKKNKQIKKNLFLLLLLKFSLLVYCSLLIMNCVLSYQLLKSVTYVLVMQSQFWFIAFLNKTGTPLSTCQKIITIQRTLRYDINIVQRTEQRVNWQEWESKTTIDCQVKIWVSVFWNSELILLSFRKLRDIPINVGVNRSLLKVLQKIYPNQTSFV